jgi:hypothetical protein
MKKPNIIRAALLAAFLVSLVSFSFASPRLPERVISLAGLVVNAQTLSPIESAQIFDAEGHKLGTTDKNGYYKIRFNADKPGEIHFELKIEKQGFQSFTQNEHWGDLGDTQTIMYFGLKASNAKSKSFSSFGDNHDLSYANVLAHFDKVRHEREFDGKLEAAKTGNQHVLVQIDGKCYIVDNSGWIQLNSDKDLVSIDNKKVVSADKLNDLVKRKDVSGMTPVESKEAKFLIHTR